MRKNGELKILVADDDPVIQTVISTILRNAGHDVDCASGGREALDCVAQGAPACVFLDLYMDDMSGLDVLVEIREKLDKETCPVFLMSAEEDQTSAGVAVDFGANDFLFKPVSAATLLAKIAELFGAPAAAAKVSTSAIQPGQALGAYTIQRLIRQSGDEAVYEACDQRLARKVCVKVSPTAIQEAQTLALLSHRNIVTVLDVGDQYLVTEFVGDTLEDSKCLGWSEALRWTREILRALGALHAQGLAHTSLNPSTVSLALDRHVCITDLATATSLAKKVPPQPFNLTPYTAPELKEADLSQLTLAADIYSAAATLRFLLKCLPPHAEEPGPQSAPELEKILQKGLHVDASERFQTADEFRAALGPQTRRALSRR